MAAIIPTPYQVGLYPTMGIDDTTPTETNLALDGTGDEAGGIIQAQDENAITHIGFRHETNASPPTYLASIQGVDANGLPDGTVKGGGSPASATFDPTSFGDNTFQWIELDNSYTPSLGEFLYAVIEYSSGTIGASNDMTVTRAISGIRSSISRFPTGATTTNNWSGKTDAPAGPFAFRTASTRYGLPYGATLTAGSIGTNGHREACRFQIPANTFSSVKCKGVSLAVNWPTSADFIVGLWNASGTSLGSVTVDEDYLTSTTDGVGTFIFDTEITLSPATTYYVGIERTTVACGLIYQDMDEDNNLLCFPLGTASYYGTYNLSSWSDDTGRRPVGVDLILSDMTSGAGGGGLLTHPGMQGGFNG